MNRQRYLSLAAIALLLLAATPALAVGTGAGTTISNQATVDFQVGGVAQPQATSVEAVSGDPTTDFTVDRKIDLVVATTNIAAITVTPGSTTGYITFTVTNNGNDIQDFSLTAVPLANTTANPFGGALTDSFDGSATNIYIESGATAGYQALQDTATYIDELSATAPNNVKTVYIVITIPNTQVQDDLAVYALRATARVGGGAAALGIALANDGDGNTIDGVAETIFADGTGSNDTTGNYDAEYSARSAFVVSTATLTITKSVSVFDTGGGLPSDTYAIPGAVMTYSITISNTGGQAATGVTLVDQIPANTSFYVTSGPTGGDGSGTQYAYSNQTPFVPASPTWTETPTEDGNGIDTDVTAIKIKAADIAAAGSATVTFKVKIN